MACRRQGCHAFQGMVSDRLNRAGWYLIVAPIVGLVNFIVMFPGWHGRQLGAYGMSGHDG